MNSQQEVAVAALERPVFLFAASWRSGSTMVQRLLMTDPDCFLWGEPFSRAAPFQTVAEQQAPFDGTWPDPGMHWKRVPAADVTTSWIATIHPGIEQFVAAQRQFLATLLAPPPTRMATRWGAKEVRCGGTEAQALRQLFPGARFVYLVRNPLDCWRSYASVRRWFDRWPDRITTPEAFGSMWRALVFGMVEDKSDSATIVRYEDILAEPVAATARLAEHVDLKLDPTSLSARVRGDLPSPVAASTDDERLIAELDGAAERVGYSFN